MERKNPFESNNGLRATDRTSQSISLAWPSLNDEIPSLTQSSQDEQTKLNDKPGISLTVDTTTEENEVILANRLSTLTHRTGNWIEVQMKKGEQAVDWFSIYKGYGSHFTIDDLAPDSVFVFRMKNHTDSEWGSEVVASTTPAPASVEDLNRAVEINSEYLVSRILTLSKSMHVKKIIAAHDRNGMTALMVACHIGNVSIAEKLIRVGCDINAESSEAKRTPLIYASIAGHQNMVMFLDKRKARWRCRDRSGCNALDYAIIGGHLGILNIAISRLGVRYILRDRDRRHGWSPLMRAVIQSDSLEVVQFLIAKGADVNSTDKYKNKSVLAAAILGKKPIFVKYLLTRGANVFFENQSGKDCLQMARILGYREITEILTQHINSVECSKS